MKVFYVDPNCGDVEGIESDKEIIDGMYRWHFFRHEQFIQEGNKIWIENIQEDWYWIVKP